MDEHIYYHKFCNHMKRWYYKEYNELGTDFNPKGRVLREFDSSQMLGWDAMERVERYAEKNPEIKIVQVDDSVFASSMLVIIPHPKMGTTVIFIPQCTDNQNEFFLYPNHKRELLKALGK